VAIGDDRAVYELQLDNKWSVKLRLEWQPRSFDPKLGSLLVGDEGYYAVLGR